jgi:hypothetical protein
MFTQKRAAEKKRVFIDQVQKEKITEKNLSNEKGVFLSFVPVYDKDIFDDDIVEKLKLYLVNFTNVAYEFKYQVDFDGVLDFELTNQIHPNQDFYLHAVPFDELSHHPKFNVEFSLLVAQKGKEPYFETFLKPKGKQIFKRIEELQQKNEATFKYILFEEYPDKAIEEKIDVSKLGNAGFRMYEASQIRSNLPLARSVVDLHIEKVTESWSHLSNFEILSLQLDTFEKYYQLSVLHRASSLIIIHGIGAGRLKDEIHELLRSKKEVKSFVNQYHAQYGYGATEIFFNY